MATKESTPAPHTPAPDIVKRDNAQHPSSDDPQIAKMGIQPRPVVDEPVKTVGQEQIERSAEMDAEGIEKWKARHDDRDPKDRPIVAGISNLLEDDDRAKKK